MDSSSGGDPVQGVLVIDERGRVDGAEDLPPRLRSSSALRRLVERLAGAARRGRQLRSEYRVAGGLRARVIADPVGGRLVLLLGAPEPPKRLDPAALTDRERTVVEHVAAGRPDDWVAARLRISVATVRWHLTNVYRKTGLTGRAELRATWPTAPAPQTREPRREVARARPRRRAEQAAR